MTEDLRSEEEEHEYPSHCEYEDEGFCPEELFEEGFPDEPVDFFSEGEEDFEEDLDCLFSEEETLFV
jgi:hypothetical protein